MLFSTSFTTDFSFCRWNISFFGKSEDSSDNDDTVADSRLKSKSNNNCISNGNVDDAELFFAFAIEFGRIFMSARRTRTNGAYEEKKNKDDDDDE